MLTLITRVLLVALMLLILATYVPGITVDGVYAAIVTAVVLGLLNLIVRPILFLLTLPITILSLGLFIFIINALLFWFASSFLAGFTVEGFWSALLGSAVISLVSMLGNRFLTPARARSEQVRIVREP